MTALISVEPAQAASPTGWSPVIIPTGQYRQQIQSLPIHSRPGRPLHVYGNTVRMLDQVQSSEIPVRPLRQIFFGSPTLLRTRR